MNAIHVDAAGSATEQHPVVPSASIENLINQRAAALERYEKAIALLQEANQIVQHAGLGEIRFEVNESPRPENLLGTHGLSSIRRALDLAGWRHLMNESGLRTFMDAKARAEWDANLDDESLPELTHDTISATFAAIHGSRGELFERGVVEMFRNLLWSYKTNSPVKFGKRVIVKQLFTTYGNTQDRWLSLNHRTTNELDDLTRVFCVVDGVPQPDHRQGAYTQLSQQNKATQREAEFTYFSVRWFLNGNGHVTFKRPDLVDQLNRILAKHYPNALPAST